MVKFTAIITLLFSVAVGAIVTPAQGATAGSATVGASAGVSTGLAIPEGYTVVPPNDNDRSDDRIVQLENLTIQNISVSVPGTIYASRDIGGPCREYLNVSGVGGSKIYPCPMAPMILYQISVQTDTILLLKNRTRANIGDFAVGDHINVFGFLDSGTSGVQALIVRDLDKPVGNEGRYVQLNSLTVATGPASSTLPTSFRAARKGIEPCLSFDSFSSARGISAPCPMGVDISVSAEILNSTTSATYRPFRQYYNVQVNEKTKLIGLYRQSIGLSDIKPGDTVNIYGRYIPGTRMVEALIVRDLSMPRNADNLTPSISSIGPDSGDAGTTITLRGENFTRSGNVIYFGNYYIVTASSTDGVSLTFGVPEYVSACPLDPYNPPRPDTACIAVALQIPNGNYAVRVRNAGGVSNNVIFEMTSSE